MSYAIPIIDEYPFKRFFVYSLFLHAGLTLLIVVGIWVQRTGERWGGPGYGGDSSVKVNLAPSAGLPMPQPTNVTDSGVVDPTKSLHKEEPLPPPPELKPDATEIPRFTKEKPLPPSKKSKIFEKKTPDVDNAVPGKGGSPNLPSGYNNSPGPLNPGGAMVARGEGGGDFAGRYPWYVQSIVRAISQNWMQTTIDPSVRAARRAKTTMTFTINRDGSIKNIRLSESSGNRSMDDSAQRALLGIDHFPPLPADYSGRYVDVTFDFDLSMSR